MMKSWRAVLPRHTAHQWRLTVSCEDGLCQLFTPRSQGGQEQPSPQSTASSVGRPERPIPSSSLSDKPNEDRSTAMECKAKSRAWLSECRTRAQSARHDARSAPQDDFERGPVEISLSNAVRTHALWMHRQDRFGGRHRRAGRRGTAAHRPHLVAHTLHRLAYAALIRPREKHPRNSHTRRSPQRETAGQAPAPLHEVRA